MSERNTVKAARLVALTNAIEAGQIDADTVNMSELARMFKVNRSTILRDLRMAAGVVELSQQFRSQLTAHPPTETFRR